MSTGTSQSNLVLEERYERLKLILDISRRLSSNLELQVLLREAAASVRRATQNHGRLIIAVFPQRADFAKRIREIAR